MRNECGRVKVSKQVLISLSIGSYQDEILCDVAPIQTSHILLGQPWKFQRRAKHDEYQNHYSFDYNNRRMTLTPLEPFEAYEDQLRIMKQFGEREKEKIVRKENERKELEETSEKQKSMNVQEEKSEEQISVAEKEDRDKQRKYEIECRNQQKDLGVKEQKNSNKQVSATAKERDKNENLSVEKKSLLVIARLDQTILFATNSILPCVEVSLLQEIENSPEKFIQQEALQTRLDSSNYKAKIRGRIFLKKGGMMQTKEYKTKWNHHQRLMENPETKVTLKTNDSVC